MGHGGFLESDVGEGRPSSRSGHDAAIVTGVQGISWQELTITGQCGHAGATPTNHRHDAGLVASLINVQMREMAESYGPLRYLINTEHHVDHIFGNYFFKGAGTVIHHQGVYDNFMVPTPELNPYEYALEALPTDDPAADGYSDIVDVTRKLCDHCDNNHQFLHLETGQETAAGLLEFINQVDRANLKINFDPANMILYGTGEPIEALRQVGAHVRSVHCKDANWSDQPGETWGEEVALGSGQVGMEAYLKTLQEIGYTGPLTIEREIPSDPDRQKTEIGGAIDLLARLRSEILG